MAAFEASKHEQFGYLISHARNALFTALGKEMLPLGLTSSRFLVVISAMRHGARTANAFCQLAGIAPGPMSHRLDRLEDKGIVRRVRDLEHR